MAKLIVFHRCPVVVSFRPFAFRIAHFMYLVTYWGAGICQVGGIGGAGHTRKERNIFATLVSALAVF